MFDKYYSVLLLGFNKIGDSLHQTRIYRSLKNRSVPPHITVLCTPAAASVVQNNPNVDELVVSPVIPGLSFIDFVRYWILCFRIVLRRKVDMVICDTINANPASALIMKLLPVRYKVYGAPVLKRWHTILMHDLLQPNKGHDYFEPLLSQTDRLLSGIGCDSEGIVAEVYPSENEKTRADRFMRNIKERCKGPYISLIPFSKQQATSWPIGNLKTFLIEAARKYCVIVFGGNEEDKALLVADGQIVPAFDLNIREAFWAIKQTDLLVSLDTGPSHFFTGLDIPMLKLNSARIPAAMWGYHGNPRYHEIQLQVPCGHCNSSTCKNNNHLCMEGMTAEMVMETIDTIIP